jgi:hypothetical protein
MYNSELSCIFSITNSIDHFCFYLLPICIFPFVKCLLNCFALTTTTAKRNRLNALIVLYCSQHTLFFGFVLKTYYPDVHFCVAITTFGEQKISILIKPLYKFKKCISVFCVLFENNFLNQCRNTFLFKC